MGEQLGQKQVWVTEGLEKGGVKEGMEKWGGGTRSCG
jgi:hypothetical protein